jgi:hypothetical protein
MAGIKGDHEENPALIPMMPIAQLNRTHVASCPLLIVSMRT